MKTSNKLLLGLTALIFLTLITILLIIRAHAEDLPGYSDDGESSSEKITKTINTPVTSQSFELGSNHTYMLDSSAEGIIIKGPKNIVEATRVVDDGVLRFVNSQPLSSNNNSKLNISIGTKGLNLTKLSLSGNAKCESDRAPYAMSQITLSGNAKLNKFTVNSEQLQYDGSGNTKGTIAAMVDNIEATVSGNSDLYFKDNSELGNLQVTISGNGSIDGEKAMSLAGSVGGNGKLEIDEVSRRSQVTTSGNGRDYSNYHE